MMVVPYSRTEWGVPRVHAYETGCEYNAMVFDLLGPSLEDLFNFCGRHFSLKTVLMLVDQLIHRLEYFHPKRIIHRDIKPENFLMGVGKYGNQVYVTDLGLVTERRNTQVKADTDGSRNPYLIGTARFASINGCLGVGTYDVLASCCTKTDYHPSPISSRRFGILRIHASIFPPGLSSMARSHGRGSNPKGGIDLETKGDDQYIRSVRGPS